MRSVSAFAALGAVIACASSTLGGVMLPSGGETLDVILDAQGPYNGTFVVGDKEISVKSFSGTFDATSVTVVPVNFGLQAIGFDLLGQFIDAPNDQDSSGFTFEYNVTVLEPGFSITGIELGFNGSTSVPGSFAQVTETIVDPMSTMTVDELSVFNVAGQGTQFQDSFLQGAPGFTTLNVTKEFELFAGDGGSATTSFIRQTFEQVPTPGAVALAGVAGLSVARRRRGA
ncbi:MAG: hypothetical protein AAGD00_07210 [Planctomycetota bacterium]